MGNNICSYPMGMTTTKKPKALAVQELPEVNFSDDGDHRYLHLGSPWIQGSMRVDQPYELDLEYIQRMMAWLLFVPPEKVKTLHAMQLGLGAASLTKYCRKKLLMKTTVFEINPSVVMACRTWFKLPANDSKLNVVVTDALSEITDPKWHGSVDALMVELYDDDAKAPVADSASFYQDCRRLLTDTGVMTVNLFGRSNNYDESLLTIQSVFGEDAVWAFKPTREGNAIVMAQARGQTLSKAQCTQAAEVVAAHWGLPAKKWLRVLSPPEKVSESYLR